MCLKVCATTPRGFVQRLRARVVVVFFFSEAAAAAAQTMAVNILQAAATLRWWTSAAQLATAILLPALYAGLCATARGDDGKEEEEEDNHLALLDWLWIGALLAQVFLSEFPNVRKLAADELEGAAQPNDQRSRHCPSHRGCNRLSCRAVLENKNNSIDVC